MKRDVIYLDYAATSAVRPAAVRDAVAAYLNDVGGTPGRGGHSIAAEAGRVALRCRMALAKLLGLRGDPGRLAFGYNATHALNTALWGVLRPGDAVAVTVYDHNAVLRPAFSLAERRGVSVRLVPGDRDGVLDPDALEQALDGARLLVVNAVSNVLGTALPVAELAAKAHTAGALVLVDAAQAAGHVPIDVEADGIDLLAITGHKGLLGPQGVGGLWVRPGIDVEPLLTGGTGSESLSRAMPVHYPDHLEAGTTNGPGIAGLLAGVEFVLERGVRALHEHSAALKARLRDGLGSIPGVRLLSPADPNGAGIVTMVADGIDPGTLAGRLDREHGVLVRPGHHCAPEVHRLLGTTETGAVRFSVGWATTEDEIDRAVEAVARVLASARGEQAGRRIA